MSAGTLTLYGLVIASWCLAPLAFASELPPKTAVKACVAISKSISPSSSVFFPSSPQYQEDISHWGGSSSQPSACSVEPGTADDVGKILRLVGSSRTAFGVKGGGHATNPGFSSSPGILISMSRFNEVTFNAATKTATVGAGSIWDDVHLALEKHGVTVVGGRTQGVGVAGFTLGGGYSWKSNQHGLTLDTVFAFELVLPNGRATSISAASDPDLFFALRGGGNNFGIVTRFIYKTYPQTLVWGGQVLYNATEYDAFNSAVAKFANSVSDPKASILALFNFNQGQAIAGALMFYDAPTPPSGIFDELLSIPSIFSNITTKSYTSFVADLIGERPTRIAFDTISVTGYSPTFLKAVANETKFWGSRLSQHSMSLLTYAVEPFLPTLFAHTNTPSAYPFTRARSLSPFQQYLSWNDSSDDTVMLEAVRQSMSSLHRVVAAEGMHVARAPLYPNYAISGTTAEAIYGDNLPRLRRIKERVDPENVMGLAGGFKI